ncbi:hypothetical protein Tco_0570140, partial [Tanacetum coccineum]
VKGIRQEKDQQRPGKKDFPAKDKAAAIFVLAGTIGCNRGIEKRIDDGNASLIDRDKRVQLLSEIDKLDNFDSLDMIQKAHIK